MSKRKLYMPMAHSGTSSSYLSWVPLTWRVASAACKRCFDTVPMVINVTIREAYDYERLDT